MKTEITFPGIVHGMNGKYGLLRMNWRKRTKLKATYLWWVKSKTKNKHAGSVKLTLIRHSTRPHMDYDNLVSTGKHIIDSMVEAGVIIDDKPAIIKERVYEQVKAAYKTDQKTVIVIEDI